MSEALETFQSNLQRARHLINIHRKLHGGGRGRPLTHLVELSRAALVFVVAAFDAYVHQKVFEKLATGFPSPYPERLVELAKELERESPSVLYDVAHAPDPKRHLLTLVDAALHRRTFQHPGQVEDAFKLVGIHDVWSEVVAGMRAKEDRLKRDIAKFIRRRHQIVHEADFDKKAGRVRAIQRWEVEWCLELFEDVVSVMDAVC